MPLPGFASALRKSGPYEGEWCGYGAWLFRHWFCGCVCRDRQQKAAKLKQEVFDFKEANPEATQRQIADAVAMYQAAGESSVE